MFSNRMNLPLCLLALCLTTACVSADRSENDELLTAAGKPAEAGLEPFLGEARFDMQQIFTGERFPNVVVATDGSVIATWGRNNYWIRRSEDGGQTWQDEIKIADPGFHGGGVTVDENRGDILAFVEQGHPPSPLTVYRSKDHGKTWQVDDVTILPNSLGHMPDMHMNERGITLRHGEHAGRLIRPTRWYAGSNNRSHWPEHYTNAMYSDDGGRTWQTSEPFPEKGTGEATLVELSDGRIYYNSRVHWPQAENPIRRRIAWSHDGGHTWVDWRIVEELPDGRQDNAYGLMAGLVRLPVKSHDILIFSNIDTPRNTRERITVWASFDGGKTWPIKRLVHDGPGAYSSLAAGRPGTPSEGWIYLMFEGGDEHMYQGAQMARFNLTWLLDGKDINQFLPSE